MRPQAQSVVARIFAWLVNRPRARSGRWIAGRTVRAAQVGLHIWLCALAPAWAAANAAQANTLIVYVVPQFPVEEMYRTWSPVLDRVGALANVRLELRMTSSIPEFERLLQRGIPDLAYMNPYHAVMVRSEGYEPILRDGSVKLAGILVVRNDSTLTNVGQLEGKEIAFPAPNAFGASLYMRALLAEKMKLEFTPRYFATHSNVYRQVLQGSVMAGGGLRATLNAEPEELRSQLRILYETPASNPHPISVGKRVAPDVRVRLQQAFLTLAKDPQGAKLLAQVQLPQLQAATYADYRELEKLGLEKFVVKSRD